MPIHIYGSGSGGASSDATVIPMCSVIVSNGTTKGISINYINDAGRQSSKTLYNGNSFTFSTNMPFMVTAASDPGSATINNLKGMSDLSVRYESVWTPTSSSASLSYS